MTRAGPAPPDVRADLIPVAIRASGRILALLYAVVGYLGIVVLGPHAVLAVAAMGVVVPAVVAAILVNEGERSVPARRLLPAAVIGAGVIPFAAGVSRLGVVAVAPILVMIVSGGVLIFGMGLLDRAVTVMATPHRLPEPGQPTIDAREDDLPGGSILIADGPTGASPGAVSSSHAVDDEQLLRVALRGASLQAVFRQWRMTSRQLAAHDAGCAGERRLAAIRIRELLLEEMERRDPDGVRRWLLEGPVDSPHRYVRGDRDVGV